MDDLGKQMMAHANQAHLKGNRPEAERLYLQLCGMYPQWAFPPFSLGTFYTEQENFGLAIPLLNWSITLDPNNKQAWNNLGASLRATGHHNEAVNVLEHAMQMDPRNIAVYANLSGCYINNGTPDQAVHWASKGLKIEPLHPQCNNHMALGLLERGDWGEGFDHWERRIFLPGWSRRDTGSLPRWEGEEVDCLAVIGEQGIGDEIMFTSIIADAAKRCRHVAVEVTPRLKPLMDSCYLNPGNVVFYPSWLELMQSEKPDAWSMMGGLGRLFRRNTYDCPGIAYLQLSADRIDAWRVRLSRLGPPPYVGLAWRGGTPKTHAELRCMALQNWEPIMGAPCTFVSVQYGRVGTEAGMIGLPHWAQVSFDFVEHTALIAACDLIISVCQTAVHQAGAQGVPCWCLTPSKAAWRYLTKGECMPWYNSVRQYRQADQSTDWAPVIKKVAHDLHLYAANFGAVPQAERGAA